MRDQPTPEQTPERIAKLVERLDRLSLRAFGAHGNDAELYNGIRDSKTELAAIGDALTATLAHLTQEGSKRDNWSMRWQARAEAAERGCRELEATLARVKAQQEDLRVLVEDFNGWWHLNRNGSVNAAYAKIDTFTKTARALVDPPVSSSTETKT